jgi:anaerobic ribonucleoside-triphosphate reductase activating protein
VISLTAGVYLNVAKTLSHSRANGPGVRAVIWVQGCTIGCKGCYSGFTHPHKKVNLMSPAELATWVANIGGIEGITLSGGEPFEQAEAVAELLNCIKTIRPDLSIFLFSGYEYEFLTQSTNPNIKQIMTQIDILSSGPFISELYDEYLLWKGSSNQELAYISERYDRSNEYRWIKTSPIEEINMNATSLEYTGFKGKGGDLYKHLRNL